MARLQTDQVTLSYGGPTPVVRNLTLRVRDGAVTTLIGPNGCGKSTLLRALARLMAPKGGAVLLDGALIHRLPTREVARRLGLLPQQPAAPESITVEDLTRRGRYPHQGFFQPPTHADQAAVDRALALTHMTALRDRPVDELSGGQRQRAWIAMALAQETPLLLLDEPTTYLDLAHQQEVLGLLRTLNRTAGRTLLLVLHDVNDAAQISDHVVAMRDGAIVAEGAPSEVINSTLLETLFGIACDVVLHPQTQTPVAVPRGQALAGPPAAPSAAPAELRVDTLTAGYGERRVVQAVSLTCPAGRVTAIIGPNACGKSTLLRACARLLTPQGGAAYLDGRPVQAGRHRAFAQQLALLSQGSLAPPGVLVEDLVALGRYPYQAWYRQWSQADQQAIEHALAATGLIELRWRPLDTLSGGQQQRVWLALALAQQTRVLLLDEPTTFLDIAHQVEVLERVRAMNRADGRTIVMVLHDLSLACRYADHLIAMKDGRIAAAGAPWEVITPALVRDVFGVESSVVPAPGSGTPLVLPRPYAGHQPEDAPVHSLAIGSLPVAAPIES